MADKPEGEGNFNIFYQLMSGADEQLKNELMFNVPVDTEEKNLYLEPHDDVSGGEGGVGGEPKQEDNIKTVRVCCAK